MLGNCLSLLSDVGFPSFLPLLRDSFGMIQQAIGAVFEYGVWWAGFTYHRLPVLIAVDSFGDIRKWRAVKPLEDGEALGERMWTWLRQVPP
jgi:hypothetical protein